MVSDAMTSSAHDDEQARHTSVHPSLLTSAIANDPTVPGVLIITCGVYCHDWPVTGVK